MNSLEKMPLYQEFPSFDIEKFGTIAEFDINAAFLEAISSVVSDSELALEEKVRRMEVIVSESVSPVYNDFVDFRQMAAQMEMICNHDHSLSQSMLGSEAISGFMDSHKADNKHSHGDELHSEHNHDDDQYEIDPKTGKKIKKKKRTFKWYLFIK